MWLGLIPGAALMGPVAFYTQSHYFDVKRS